MFDYDAVIVGGGPAGLTAGIYLSRAGWRTIVLEQESFGGYLKKIERIENYPGFAKGISGNDLAAEMVNQAQEYGVQLEPGEVANIEIFSRTRWVGCENGQGYTTAAVIIAGGCRQKKLGVPGEDLLLGKGVFSCALCDGGHFADKVVAICGGGDAGVTEALYMSRLASKVYLIETEANLTASAVLQDRVKENPKIEILCGTRVQEITGTTRVEGISCLQPSENKSITLDVEGILVHIGIDPNTTYLQEIVPLNEDERVEVHPDMESGVPYVFAAGDIRSGSPGQVATAVGDGATAAISAQRLLQEMNIRKPN
jgi:thioredoxin reductase (NADPH)